MGGPVAFAKILADNKIFEAAILIKQSDNMLPRFT